MKIIDIEKRDEDFIERAFERFFSMSFFTLEGIDLSEESVKDIEDFLFAHGYDYSPCLAYRISGKLMNDFYLLTEENAYPEDLNLLVIPNYYDVAAKASCNARWFDDIVCNNRIRQHGIDTGLEPDYD